MKSVSSGIILFTACSKAFVFAARWQRRAGADQGRPTGSSRWAAALSLFVLAACLVGPLSGSDSLEPIPLPPPETGGGMPLMQALHNRKSTKSFTQQAIPRGHISNLLWAAFGINRPESGKRTAATAVNCQDIQIYVVFEKAALNLGEDQLIVMVQPVGYASDQ